MSTQPASRPATEAAGRRPFRLRAAAPAILIGLALLGSIAYILWVVREVEDEQIKLLSFGFVALGLTFAAMAIGCLVAMWRASSRAEGGRSFGLALLGGFAGLAAIGSFSVVALLTLLLSS